MKACFLSFALMESCVGWPKSIKHLNAESFLPCKSHFESFAEDWQSIYSVTVSELSTMLDCIGKDVVHAFNLMKHRMEIFKTKAC